MSLAKWIPSHFSPLNLLQCIHAQNFSYVGSSFLFLINDNQILLQRRFQTGFEDGTTESPIVILTGEKQQGKVVQEKLEKKLALK